VDDRFGFAFDDRWRRWLGLVGVTERTAHVTVGETELLVRFGPWQLETTMANVAAAQETGPYRWWRAIGPHLSLADQGVTFGSNAWRGACVRFHQPVPALFPVAWPRHPGLTVTLDDVTGFVERISGPAAVTRWRGTPPPRPR
jgi:hypothetical protein